MSLSRQDGSSVVALEQASAARLHSSQTVPLRLCHPGRGHRPSRLRPQLQRQGAPGEQAGLCHHSAGFSNRGHHPQMCLLQVELFCIMTSVSFNFK